MKVLIIIPHLELAASNRYRVYQYLPYLHKERIITRIRPFVNSINFYRILYQKGNTIKKVGYSLLSLVNRFQDLLSTPGFDVIFIQREALPFGPAFFERFVKKSGRYLIYDFDDAIYLRNISDANKFLSGLKFPSKISSIIKNSDQVIVSNNNLQKFAVRYNQNTTIIPTCVDTDYYKLRPFKKDDEKPIIIGWIGSNSTIKYIHILDEVLLELSKKFPIQIKVIGGEYTLHGTNFISSQWNKESELNDLHTFDIGIMPMPDNEWTQGKSGLKAILYSSIGIPAVVSPIGINNQIVLNGENGFHAVTSQDWYNYLSILIRDSTMRKEMGFKGREIVENKFSLKVNAPKFVNVFKATFF